MIEVICVTLSTFQPEHLVSFKFNSDNYGNFNPLPANSAYSETTGEITYVRTLLSEEEHSIDFKCQNGQKELVEIAVVESTEYEDILCATNNAVTLSFPVKIPVPVSSCYYELKELQYGTVCITAPDQQECTNQPNVAISMPLESGVKYTVTYLVDSPPNFFNLFAQISLLVKQREYHLPNYGLVGKYELQIGYVEDGDFIEEVLVDKHPDYVETDAFQHFMPTSFEGHDINNYQWRKFFGENVNEMTCYNSILKINSTLSLFTPVLQDNYKIYYFELEPSEMIVHGTKSVNFVALVQDVSALEIDYDFSDETELCRKPEYGLCVQMDGRYYCLDKKVEVCNFINPSCIIDFC